MSLDKGEYGYIKNYKKRKLISTVLILVIALGIFFVGYFINDRSNKNIFSVMSVLLMLPMARVCVALIIAIPFKSLLYDEYNLIESKKENGVVKYDLIITSSEKVMNIDSMCITDSQIIMLITNKKQDKDYIKKYIEKYCEGRLYNRTVKISTDKKDYVKNIGSEDNEKKKENEEIAKEILILNI